MRTNGKRLVIDSEFLFIGLTGSEYSDIEIVSLEGSIIRQNRRGVKIWRNRRVWLRWHLENWVGPVLTEVTIALLLMAVLFGWAA